MSNPVYFPQISSYGLMVQRPYKVSSDFNTIFQDNPFARPYSYSKRASGNPLFSPFPLGDFFITFTSISDAEVATLSAFFDTMQGRLNEFVYLDPGGNLVNNSEDFTQTSWTSQMTSVSLAATGVTDPYGGTRASTLTATSSNSLMSPIVVPGGFLPAGFVMNVSVWVRALNSGQNFALGFKEQGGSNISQQIFALPHNQWKRIDSTCAITDNSPICAVYGGNGTWNASSIQFFGPQCVPMTGPGGYSKTPDNFGYTPQCRFDTDMFTFQAKAPNDSSVILPVTEYYLS